MVTMSRFPILDLSASSILAEITSNFFFNRILYHARNLDTTDNK